MDHSFAHLRSIRRTAEIFKDSNTFRQLMRKNDAIALLAIVLLLFIQSAVAIQPGCISLNVSDDTSKPVNSAVISVDGIPRGMASNSQANS